MSKTVVFESEKMERRQRLKHLLLPVALLLAVVLLTVIIAVIAGKSKGKSYSGGEDTPYPYSWTENKNGSLTLLLANAKEAGFAWTAKNNSDPSVAEAVKEAKSPKGKTGFSVKPLAAGRTLLELSLENEAAEQNGRIYLLNVVLDVAEENGKLKTTLASAAGIALPGTVSGGEAEGWPYQIAAASAAAITVTLKDPMREFDRDGGEEAVAANIPEGASAPQIETLPAVLVMNSWDCTSSDEEVVRVRSLTAEEGIVTAELDVRSPGSAEITLRSDTGGAELVFTVTAAEDGTFTVGGNALNRFEPPTQEDTGYDTSLTEAAPGN